MAPRSAPGTAIALDEPSACRFRIFSSKGTFHVAAAKNAAFLAGDLSAPKKVHCIPHNNKKV